MRVASGNRKWVIFASLMFAAAGGLCLLITDLIFVPLAPGTETTVADRLWFSTWPPFALSSIVPPMIAAGFSAYWWLFKGSKFFGGWLNVAVAAWFALAINPVIWLLVTMSYTLFGAVTLGVFAFTGLIMSGLWRARNA